MQNPLLARTLRGTLTLPGDKSISHRALMFLSLARGTADVQNLSSGKDVLSTLTCLQNLGANIAPIGQNAWRVTGGQAFLAPSKPLDCGNSGTTMRLLSGIIAGMGLPAMLTGDESLSQRPMKRIIEPLTQMGAVVQALGTNQSAPLHFLQRQTPLRGVHYAMPVASAQVKSAILLAGLFTDPAESVVIEEPVPSRDHTERMLAALGAQVSLTPITLIGRRADLLSQDITIPGDISSAAFWLVGAAILPGSNLIIQQVSLNPTRLGVLKVLAMAGASVTAEETLQNVGEPYGNIQLHGGALKGDITITPEMVPELIDEIPILTVLGLFTQGMFTLHGAEELRFKESDRLKALMETLKALKVDFTAYPDGFSFEGNPDWQVPKVETPLATHHDHRLVMALEILNLRSFLPLPIEGKEWVSISYPGFYETLSRLLA